MITHVTGADANTLCLWPGGTELGRAVAAGGDEVGDPGCTPPFYSNLAAPPVT
jgi:hypothetical protein